MESVHIGRNEPDSVRGEWVDKYEYAPLKKNEIRLLEIVPADLTDPLQLRLHNVSLDDLPTYGALSYTWGNNMNDRIAFIDRKALIIKPGLEAALLQFRCKPPFKHFGIEKLWQALDLFNSILGKWEREGILQSNSGTAEMPDAIESMKADNSTCAKVAEEKISALPNQIDAFQTARDDLDEWAEEEADMAYDRCERAAASRGMHLPARNPAHLLWIDGVCINQSDLSERRAQVLLMGKIYQRSRRLIIWLGTTTATSDLAIKNLDQFRQVEEGRAASKMIRFEQWVADSGLSALTLDDLVKHKDYFDQFDGDTNTSFTQWLYASGCSQEEVRNLPVCQFLTRLLFEKSFQLICTKRTKFERSKIRARCSAVMDLLQNPWFTRCWIIQEFALGGRNTAGREDIVTCCGKLCVASFIAILNCVDLHQFPLRYEYSLTRMKVVHNSLGGVRRKYKLRQRTLLVSKSEYLLRCVADFMVSAVTDPRDKIYSLLGLIDQQYSGAESNHHKWTALIIDYNATVEDVWSSFVQEVVQSTKRLDILGFCDGQRNEHCQRTWTLNCCPKDGEGDFFMSILATDIQYSDLALPFTKELQFNVTPGTIAAFQFADDLSTLKISGFVWTEITQLYNIKFAGPWELQSAVLSMLQWGEKSTVSASTEFWEERLLSCLILAPKGAASTRVDFAAVAGQLLDGFKDWVGKDIDEEWEKIQRNTRAATDWPMHGSPPTRFSANLAQAYTGGQIVMAKDGYVGRAISPLVEAGDLICVLLGCAMPMVLHPVKDYFEVRGEIYVPGIMHGEAVTGLNAGERTLRNFELH